MARARVPSRFEALPGRAGARATGHDPLEGAGFDEIDDEVEGTEIRPAPLRVGQRPGPVLRAGRTGETDRRDGAAADEAVAPAPAQVEIHHHHHHTPPAEAATRPEAHSPSGPGADRGTQTAPADTQSNPAPTPRQEGGPESDTAPEPPVPFTPDDAGRDLQPPRVEPSMPTPVRPRRIERARPAPQAEDTSPAPTPPPVTVTIGRIEIRAIPAPSPPSPTPAPSRRPAPSRSAPDLAAYLEGHR